MKYDNLTPLDKGEVLSESEALAQLDKYKSQPPQIPEGHQKSKGFLSGSQPTAHRSPDYIHLQDIACINSMITEPVEQHNNIWVYRNHIGPNPSVSTYKSLDNWISYFKCRPNYFLPSLPLTCNILSKCYKEGIVKDSSGYTIKDPKLENFLTRYFTHGNHAHNTVINWKTCSIINYPNKGDYTPNLNTRTLGAEQSQPRYFLPFPFDLRDFLLSQPDKVDYNSSHPGLELFIQTLTCLEKNDFQKVTDYIHKKIMIYLPKGDVGITTIGIEETKKYLNIYTQLPIDYPLVTHAA